MKTNKGFGVLGILLIIVGVLALGGGAYYINKNTKYAPKNFPEGCGFNGELCTKNTGGDPAVLNNNINTPPVVAQPDCLPATAPWIKILSPNGGEVYQMGQEISIKWKSCNGSSDAQIMITLKSTQSTYGSEIATVPDTGSATITLPTSLGGGQASLALGKYYKIVTQLNGNAMGYTAPTDSSDNTFTINFSSSTEASWFIPNQSGWVMHTLNWKKYSDSYVTFSYPPSYVVKTEKVERRAGLFVDQTTIIDPNSRSDFDDTIFYGVPYTGANDPANFYEIKENVNNTGVDFAISLKASNFGKYVLDNIAASAYKK